MIDQLRQMAIFSKTIDHGSFRGAAKELNLSPSVVSHHISQLEEHLGVALIYRSTRKLSLTRDGERLLEATRKMLSAVEGELQNLSESADIPSGELRMTVPSVLAQSDIPERIARFCDTYPRIKLQIDFSDTRRELIEDGYDFAIRMGPKSGVSATTRTLFKVKRTLVASVVYMSTRQTPANPTELVNLDWISLAPVQNVPLTFKRPDEKPVTINTNSQISTNDATALYHLAKAGAGLAVVPEYLIEDDVRNGNVVQILPDWQLPSIDVFAVWPANAPKHGLIHRALNMLS